MNSAVIILMFIGGIVFFLNGTSTLKNGASSTVKINPNLRLSAGPVVGSIKSETLGEYLTDTKGNTLYVFTDDKRLESSCTGNCLKKWPAFMYDNKDPSAFTDTLSKRMNFAKLNDGSHQYAYYEQPLYYYSGDKNPGEVHGNGLGNGKWHIVSIDQ